MYIYWLGELTRRKNKETNKRKTRIAPAHFPNVQTKEKLHLLLQVIL